MTKKTIADLGEVKVIEIIEKEISIIDHIKIREDDAFFFDLTSEIKPQNGENFQLVSNTDMLVSTTDVPEGMTNYQIGRKAVLMNISDLIVKGVHPKGMLISLGVPGIFFVSDFRDLIKGVINYGKEWKIKYLGGDLNETNELILNPTVFGIKEKDTIIHRNGMSGGDFVCTNGKFGLTGVGFDILLHKKPLQKYLPQYKKSINSVLNNHNLSKEAFILADQKLVTASIDSSDGLAKSLQDLMRVNPGLGFEIQFCENLIAEEASKYAKEVQVSLEKLIFNAGEEFIHLFTIPPNLFKKAQTAIEKSGGNLFKIGEVISEDKILIRKENDTYELKKGGFEHFI
ncbi:MAG: AIR synthase related protein [Promethearchaeia archaeon]